MLRGLTMEKGRVKWFNNRKGFGFILPEEGGEDIFVHFSAITSEGYKTLEEGQQVLYKLEKTGRGDRAGEVVLAA